MSDRVELKPAYNWDCESCGRENFCRGVVPTIDDMDAMKAEHCIEAYDAGHFMLMPSRVTCACCGKSFDTEHYE